MRYNCNVARGMKTKNTEERMNPYAASRYSLRWGSGLGKISPPQSKYNPKSADLVMRGPCTAVQDAARVCYAKGCAHEKKALRS